MINEEVKLDDAIQLFPREDGSVSIWDHPNFKSSIVLPDEYKPLTRVEQGLELIHQGRLTKEQIMVLKVIGDAICPNEDQLRTYLSRKISRTTTSKHLTYMRKYGLVERHKCRLAFIEEDGEEVIRPPAPYTLGIGGYKLLSHYYSDTRFVSPEYWQQNSKAVQRYVAMNQIRASAVTTRKIRGWVWHPSIGGHPKYRKPFGVMRIETPVGEYQFLIDRAQMSQNFIDYFRVRLEEYRYLIEKDKMIIIDGFEKTHRQIVVLSVSTKKMAEFIQSQLHLHTYPFDIWFIVDEWINHEGMFSAVAQGSADGVKRMKVEFLKSADFT